MKALIRGLIVALAFVAPAIAQQNTDSQVQVNDSPYGQLPAAGLFVTPTGGARTTLGNALANPSGTAAITGGTVANVAITGSSVAATTLSATGATTTAGITDSAGINTTAISGYSQNSINLITSDTGTTPNIYIGASGNRGISTGLLSFYAGSGAGGSITTGGENVLIGTLAGANITTGGFSTAVGEHAMGYEITPVASTAIGNDSQRNYVSSTGGNTSVGKGSLSVGGGLNNVAFGVAALTGNSSTVVVGGTATLNDTITLTFTGNFVGSPQTTAPITIAAGETTTQMATALLSAITTNSTLNGVMGLNSSTSANVISLFWPGTATTGYSIVTSSTVTGSATETIATTGGATGNNNVALGQDAMRGIYTLTTGGANFAGGQFALDNISSGSEDVAIGFEAGQNVSTASNTILIGPLAGNALTTGAANQYSVLIGDHSGASLVTQSGVFIGGSAGQNTTTGGQTYIGISSGKNLTSGINSTAVGFQALQGAASSTSSLMTAVGNGAFAKVSSAGNSEGFGDNVGANVTTGSYNLLIGYNVAATTLTSGSDNIVICTGHTACDVATAATSNTFQLQGNNAAPFFTVSGTQTPTTSIATVAGVLNVVGAIQSNGTPGLASKTCTINTANAATGITLTIVNGLITGTTTC